MIFKWATRELFRNKKFALFFIFNLSLGYFGFFTVEGFKHTIEAKLSANAQAIMGADLAVSARRQISDSEHQKILQVTGSLPEAKSYEFFAMLNHQSKSRLVMVKAIDQSYPFYGQLHLKSGKIFDNKNLLNKLEPQDMWIYPELIDQLQLNPGEAVQLGDGVFRVSDIINQDSTQSLRAVSLAPKVYIDINALKSTGLIRFGSTFKMSYFFKTASNFQAQELQKQLFKILPDPAIQIETAENAASEANRQLGFLTDFLGLASIVALLLSSLGAVYIYRTFLDDKAKNISIYRSLGLQTPAVIWIYLTQLIILSVLSSLLSFALSYLLFPLMLQTMASVLSSEIQRNISILSSLPSILVSIFICGLICLPSLLSLKSISIAQIFRENQTSKMTQNNIYAYLPALVFLNLMCCYEAHSWKNGEYFFFTILAVVTLLVLVAAGLLALLKKLQIKRFWTIKYSLKSFTRKKVTSISLFVTLGLGMTLLNILPQLKHSLQSEFELSDSKKLPSLFLFDIQDEQLAPLQSTLQQAHIEPSFVAPLIRARILKVNGLSFERQIDSTKVQTREEELESRFRNRGVNLSYRSQLSVTETLVSGHEFTGDFDANHSSRPELSIEVQYAERLGLHLGDILTFDVQGVEIEGVVVNLRRVKWTSFQPNFFILFQNGALNEAPKNFIASIPPLSVADKMHIQNQIVTSLPNISVIDVAQVTQEILNISYQMIWSLNVMAYLALVCGFVVLFAILRTQVQQRRWEINMLKILGASTVAILSYLTLESLLVAFLCSFLGAFLGFSVSAALSYFVFETAISWSWVEPFWGTCGVLLMTSFISLFASWRIVRESSGVLLREQ